MDNRSTDGTTANPALSATDAASLLGVSQRTVRRAIQQGDLPAVKRDGRYWIDRRALERYARDSRSPHRRGSTWRGEAQSAPSFDLSRPRTPLIGRAHELTELCATLTSSHASLMTLTGPGGVGKTRLALEVAARVEPSFPGGVHLIGLAPVRDAGLVGPAIAQSFGLEGGSSDNAIDRTIKAVGDGRILLLLDNLEQVLASATDIARLFHRCPHLSILCTSRAPLRITDEVDFAVSPLATAELHSTASLDHRVAADAVQLFSARARAVKRDFAVTSENVEAIAAICHRLDGLPLAIELAATRIRVLSPAALLDRLDPRLPLLTGGPRDRPSHQQTVRDTISWSYHLLSPTDQALFQHLSVFVGGFSLAAAEAVAQAPDALEGIAHLIEHSLLHQSTDALGQPRFIMLETLREFGLELLKATTDEKDVRSRHAAWMLERARESRASWIRSDYALWNDRLEVERGNLRAALSWAVATGQRELALKLSTDSSRFWRTHGPVFEGVEWLERALALPGDVPPVLRADALGDSADLAAIAGNLDLALQRVRESEALSREIGNPRLLNEALSLRGRIWILREEFELAISVLEEALEIGYRHGQTSCIAVDLCNLGVATHMTGDPHNGAKLLEAGLSLALEIGWIYVASTVYMCLADAFRELGDLPRSRALYLDGLRQAVEQRQRRNAAIAIAGLAALAAMNGNHRQAARLCGSTSGLLEQVGAAMTIGGQEGFSKASTLARTTLGDVEFERAYNAGRDMSPGMVLLDESSERPSKHGNLTRRERDVLRLLAEGMSNQQIADELFISPRTVTNHLASIFSKLGVHSRTAAVSYALRNQVS